MSGLLVAWAVGCAAPVADDRVDTDTAKNVETDSDPVVDTPDPPDVSGAVSAVVTASGPIACVDPSARASGPFEVAPARRVALPERLFRLAGGGVVLADLTGDGLMDVFGPGVAEHQFHVQLPDGEYDERFEEHFGDIDLAYASGATPVDVDGDGDLDLFVTRWDLNNKLLRNDGTGHFTDITRASGIFGIARTQTSAWGDMDGDGDLDLFVGNYGPHPEDAFVEENFTVGDPSQLFENVGGARFIDRSDLLPDDIQRAYTFMASWQDLDGDMRSELLIINDFGWARPSRILWNRPEGLVEDDGSTGFSIPFAGMGLGIGDVNGDEIPDFVQSSWKAVSLLVSVPGNQWFEASSARGLEVVYSNDDAPVDARGRNQIFGWGTELFDVENDGDLDIAMLFGLWDEWSPRGDQHDGLFVQGDDGLFTDRAAEWSFDHEGAARGIAIGDANGDGYLDVAKRVLDGSTTMYLSRCGTDAWLRLQLSAPAPNTFAIGARVRVVDGDRVWNQWIRSGGTGMYGSGPPEAHIGLGSRDTVERVEVTWPDGKQSIMEDVSTRQVLHLARD